MMWLLGGRPPSSAFQLGVRLTPSCTLRPSLVQGRPGPEPGVPTALPPPTPPPTALMQEGQPSGLGPPGLALRKPQRPYRKAFAAITTAAGAPDPLVHTTTYASPLAASGSIPAYTAPRLGTAGPHVGAPPQGSPRSPRRASLPKAPDPHPPHPPTP